MSGTIQCPIHEHVLEATGMSQDSYTLTSKKCDCILVLPHAVLKNIEQGMNCTHVYFEDEKAYRAYREQQVERFQHLSTGKSLMEDGRVHLVF